MKTLFVVLVTAAFLAACSVSENPRVAAIQNLTTACHSVARTVNALTGFKRAGKLSEGQIVLINEMAPVAGELCDPTSPPVDTVSALNKVTAMLAQLSAVAANPAR